MLYLNLTPFIVVLLPLLSMSFCFMSKVFGISSLFVGPALIACSFVLSVYFLCDVILNSAIYMIQYDYWFFIDILNIKWSFCFDALTFSVLCVVTFVSALVHLYSIEYMMHDPHRYRFMGYLSLFTFFMIILITSNNFIQMFIGWEGVGLASYLLINFWFTRVQANKAAIKAMLVNRIGDLFILIAFFSLFYIFNSVSYDVVFSLASYAQPLYIKVFNIYYKVMDFVCFFLFLGCIAKSAQIGLHTWLPDAMEGPTPVSALLHAATMVIAGVFLLIRCSFLFEYSQYILNIITLFGSCTAIFAATTGLFQNDIKKIIAYSTCSQLGYMVFACGLSAYDVSLFHLSNHAFFKALLFLGAGSVIHSMNDEQDLRKMGGLKNLLPFSYSTFLIGSLALIGFPFLSGFYSKDAILEIAFSKYTNVGHFSYILGSLTAFFTAFYSTRILFLTFLAEPNGLKNITLNANESNIFITFPLFILSFFSVVLGYVSKDLFIGVGSDFLGQSIFILYENYSLTDVEFLDLLAKLIPFFCTLLGTFFSYYIYSYNVQFLYSIKKEKLFLSFYTFFNKKWYFDRLYNQFLTQNILISANNYFYTKIDRGLLEKFMAYGIEIIFFKSLYTLKLIQTGNISQYLFIFSHMILLIVLGTVIII